LFVFLQQQGRRPFVVWYASLMSTLLEQVVEDLRSLSREEQDRAAEALLAFLAGLQDDFRLMV
jgi:hypothetical protein